MLFPTHFLSQYCSFIVLELVSSPISTNSCRDEPTIHILLDAMNSLAKKLASRIVLPNVIKDNAITDIDLDDDEIFKSNQHLFLGGFVPEFM